MPTGASVDSEAVRVFRVGLTGGIASGKSTVARLFADLGVPVIDTDEIARALVAPGEPALTAIVATFGPDFLDARGVLDRGRLRERVFADEHARRRLEGILHPRIEAAMRAACERAGGPYQMLVVPLLFESGFERHVDRTLVVDCPEPLQRERLARRDGATPDEAARMLAAQLPRQARRDRADDVVRNDGPLDALRTQVERLHRRYTALAAQHAAGRS
jgi:dephospho-CoA kinase